MELWEERPILRMEGAHVSICKDLLLHEMKVALFVNGACRSNLSCSPGDLEDLAVGYAFYMGLLHSREELTACAVAEDRVELTVAPAPHSVAAPRFALTLTPERVYALWEEFDDTCATFRRTGAAHAVGLADVNGLVLVREDVARQNALAKVLGAAILSGITTCDKALIFSGRMSGELIEMACTCDTPILLCHGAATLWAVERAEKLERTLAGFVRHGYMNLYTHSWRIITEGMKQSD